MQLEITFQKSDVSAKLDCFNPTGCFKSLFSISKNERQAIRVAIKKGVASIPEDLLISGISVESVSRSTITKYIRSNSSGATYYD